jgi:hypothetical protein
MNIQPRSFVWRDRMYVAEMGVKALRRAVAPFGLELAREDGVLMTVVICSRPMAASSRPSRPSG